MSKDSIGDEPREISPETKAEYEHFRYTHVEIFTGLLKDNPESANKLEAYFREFLDELDLFFAATGSIPSFDDLRAVCPDNLWIEIVFVNVKELGNKVHPYDPFDDRAQRLSKATKNRISGYYKN